MVEARGYTGYPLIDERNDMALFTINVDEEWIREELAYYSNTTEELTDEQIDAIIQRVYNADIDFKYWFMQNRSNDYYMVIDTITDALKGFINFEAGDILPEDM